jgi:23S rRNA pseudouridine1911/1915/1917 synthase
MAESRLPINCRLTVAADQPLLAYLLGELEMKRAAVKNLLKYGAVRVNGTAVRQFDHPLVPGDEVTVGSLEAAAAVDQLEHARIERVYEDDALIVVDKPAGLLTVATDHENTDTLYSRLNAYLRGCNPAGTERALVVHRLDRETSGLVLFAKSDSVKRQLQDAWPTVEKLYYAVVRGCPTPAEGTISSYLREDSTSLRVYASNHPRAQSLLATTHYRVIKTSGGLSLLEVRLGTGRKHQIRVQLANRGCPVLGDRRYGKRSYVCDRLALHAGELRLVHPLTGQPLQLSSPLPKALRKLMPLS